MIKQEIIEKISKYFKLTDYEAEKVYDDIFSIIMTGVKEDNIVDVANFGEFIIKYNNGKSNGNGSGSVSGYKKTVEFLASTSLEEELNQSRYDEPKQITQDETAPVAPPAYDTFKGSSVEEELRKKREEILSKITGPILPRPFILTTEPKKEETVYTPKTEKPEEQIPAEEPAIEEPIAEEPAINEPVAEETAINEPVAEEKPDVTEHEEIKTLEEKTEEKTAVEGAEDISQKSFSDYFSEVTEETKSEIVRKPIEEPKDDVIPKSAVLLHNEIMGSESKGRIIPEEPQKQQIQPVMEAVQEPEHRAGDNSYYIWYKDSDSNPTDTQTLSYEYELLYQATKEAEYKSKLKIYVTTFIVFFSIVLLLLIFSPVIYKIFFSPDELQNIENTQEGSPNVSEQKASPNVIQENTAIQEQTQVSPPADTNAGKQTQLTQEQKSQTEQQNTQQQTEQKQTEQKQIEQKQTEQKQTEQKQQVTPPPVKKEEKKTQETSKNQKSLEQAGNQQKQQKQTQPPPQTSNKLEGVSKNSMGWLDEKFKVIYIQLENGKFTIQESAWDSDAKANKRISSIESFGIIGMKGNVVKADLGTKGTWFRARFGEFASLEEARVKAEELRSKERIKLQAMLVFLLLYA